MRSPLDVVAGLIERRPGLLLGIVVAATIGFTALATQQEVDSDPGAFALDSDLNSALEIIRTEIGAAEDEATVQVVLDAGPGGDIVSENGVNATNLITQRLRDNPLVEVSLEPAVGGLIEIPPVFSWATAIVSEIDQRGVALDDAPDDEVDSAAREVFGSPQGTQFAQLLSSDLDQTEASARSGILLVQLDKMLTPAERLDAALLVRDTIHRLDDRLGELGVDAHAVSLDLVRVTGRESSERELPVLLSITLVMICIVLGFTYRSASDVALGFVALLMTVIWMVGLGVLAGPKFLGIVGNFTPISNIVPVVLIGLGIDYALQITLRYREERRHGRTPGRSSGAAIRTVGAALLLTTATTVVGFLTNLSSPLPPIKDYGVFAALGMVGAFIVMVITIPSVRAMVDSRRLARETGAPDHAADAATGSSTHAERGVVIPDGILPHWLLRTTVLAERAPMIAVLIAVATSGIGIFQAGLIPVSFSQRDFIPPGTEASTALDLVEDLFGASLTERTFVLLKGDMTDPAVANAVLDVQDGLVNIADVRVDPDGAAQANSMPAFVAGISDDPRFTERFEDLYWTGSRFAPGADLETIYGVAERLVPGIVSGLVSDDYQLGLISVGTTAGTEIDDLPAQFDGVLRPLRDEGVVTTVVSSALLNGETNQSLIDSGLRGIRFSLLAATVLMLLYFGLVERRPLLGLLTMLCAVIVVSWVLGSMYLLGIDFNMLTVTIASVAVGIGIDFSIHMSHRFTEDLDALGDVTLAIRSAVGNTGSALGASMITTALGFGVLLFSTMKPIRQFGTVTALTIIYAFITAVLIQPSLLALWGRLTIRRHPEIAESAVERDAPEPPLASD